MKIKSPFLSPRQLAVGFVLGGAVLAGAAWLWAQQAYTPNDPLTQWLGSAAGARGWWWGLVLAAALVGVVAEGFLLFLIPRMRGPAPAPSIPFASNARLEVVWIVLPALFLVFLFGVTFQTLASVSPASLEKIEIRLIGHQWWWEVRYPQWNVVTANEFVVPLNATVQVTLETADVAHGLWVPELFNAQAALPNLPAQFEFTPTRLRDYVSGYCSEYCGVQHTQMRVVVSAVAEKDFLAWVTQQQAPVAVPTDPAALAGQVEFEQQACGDCHTIAGTAAQGTQGPDLTHLQSRQTLLGADLPNTAATLAAWLTAPDQLKPAAKMPNQELSPEQVAQLTAYLLTLK